MTVPWHPRERPIRPEILVLVCAWMAAFAVLAAVVARGRRRPAALWAIFGALLGPIAIVLLRLAPPGRCPSCGSRVHGWTWACWWCGDPVVVRPRVPAAAPTAVEPVGAVAPGTAAVGPARATAPERGDAVPAGAVDDARGPGRGRSGSTEAPGRPTRRRASSRATEPSAPRVLASAVCLRGTALNAGYRYEIRVAPGTLQFVGPVELTPGTVVLEAPLARVDATSFEGRVVVTDHVDSRPRILGAFVSVAGSGPEALAQAIVDAALAHRRETP